MQASQATGDSLDLLCQRQSEVLPSGKRETTCPFGKNRSLVPTRPADMKDIEDIAGFTQHFTGNGGCAYMGTKDMLRALRDADVSYADTATHYSMADPLKRAMRTGVTPRPPNPVSYRDIYCAWPVHAFYSMLCP